MSYSSYTVKDHKNAANNCDGDWPFQGVDGTGDAVGRAAEGDSSTQDVDGSLEDNKVEEGLHRDWDYCVVDTLAKE